MSEYTESRRPERGVADGSGRPARVVRCFCFLDLCGFSRYTEEQGDVAAVAVLTRLRTLLRSEAERRGVRITRWLGDGAMLSGLDTGAVMACAAEVRDRVHAEGPLALRGGIAQGLVIMLEGDDYIGARVNSAARLCAAALPGQILFAEPKAAVRVRAGHGADARGDVAGLAGAADVRELRAL